MFTGLVEALGEVESMHGGSLSIKAQLGDIKIGDSVAVNGVCLTVVKHDGGYLKFDVSEETLSRSNLKYLRRGDLVNLERALRASDRLGGHIVQGHVDFTAQIAELRKRGEHWSLVVRIKDGQEAYLVEKGSVAIDGISLTINKVEGGLLFINVIPHTYENTNLRTRRVGDLVNVELDIIGKYVVNYLRNMKGDSLQSKLEGLYNI